MNPWRFFFILLFFSCLPAYGPAYAVETSPASLSKLVKQQDWKAIESLAEGAKSLADLQLIAAQLPTKNSANWPTGALYADRSLADLDNAMTAVMENRLADAEVLRAVHAKAPPYFHKAKAWGSNENWPPDLLIQFALSYSQRTLTFEEPEKVGQRNVAFWKKVAAAAGQPSANLPAILGEMLAGPVYYMREAAASNRNTPGAALEKYYRWNLQQKKTERDPDEHLETLMKNSATPLATKLHIVQNTPQRDLSGVIYAITKSQQPLPREILLAALKRTKGMGGDFELYRPSLEQLLQASGQK